MDDAPAHPPGLSPPDDRPGVYLFGLLVSGGLTAFLFAVGVPALAFLMAFFFVASAYGSVRNVAARRA